MDIEHRQRKKEFTLISQINVKSFALIEEDFDLIKYQINDAYIMIEQTYESFKTLFIAQQCLFANENERLLIFKAPHQAKNKDKLNNYEIKLIAKAMKKIHQNTAFEHTLSETFPIVIHKSKQKNFSKKSREQLYKQEQYFLIVLLASNLFSLDLTKFMSLIFSMLDLKVRFSI